MMPLESQPPVNCSNFQKNVVSANTGEAQFERHRFLTGFWVPKMVPKILQANLIFYVVFATLASQTVLAEKLKVFKNARRDASSPVLTKPPGEWEECYF